MLNRNPSRINKLMFVASLAILAYGFGDGAEGQTREAASLYLMAADEIRFPAPLLTDDLLLDYPRVSNEWRETESKAWGANGKMRDIVHQARLIDRADWPADDPNYLRNLARVRNEIGNAIYFADYKGNHAGAIELLFDQLHIYDLMCEAPTKGDWRRTFVSRASISRVVYPLALLVTADTLTNDPADHQNIQIATARKLIDVLLSQRDPDAELTEIYRGEGASFPHRPPDEDATMIRDLKRANAEQSMAAMAVAIQLFKHDKGRWPMSAVELMPDYLAKLPIDPWGDGKVSLGYVNIKSGLPDGTNRPMVYSREDSKDGLFFLAHNPSYKSYVGDASQMPLEQQKHGGQFRDIVRWEPTENLFGPSTLPLP